MMACSGSNVRGFSTATPQLMSGQLLSLPEHTVKNDTSASCSMGPEVPPITDASAVAWLPAVEELGVVSGRPGSEEDVEADIDQTECAGLARSIARMPGALPWGLCIAFLLASCSSSRNCSWSVLSSV